MEDKPVMLPEPPKESSYQKIVSRIITACLIFGGFLAFLGGGQVYLFLLGFAIQTELYRELLNVRYKEAKQKEIPYFRTLQWGWFFVPMFYWLGETINKFVQNNAKPNMRWLSGITGLYKEISGVLAIVLFILSVLSFRPKLARYQLSQFMWAFVNVMLVGFLFKFIYQNILSGLFWVLFPIGCVAINDISAYVWGLNFGRKFIQREFIAMSPSKTWEGFLGAIITTTMFAFWFPKFLAAGATDPNAFSLSKEWSKWFVCSYELPKELNAGELFFPGFLTCSPHNIFVAKEYAVPMLGKLNILPIQIHGIFYGLFASLVSPFGGFFASTIKRAYQIKDFDNLLPGHGGLMDRMDCQVFMIFFTAFHYSIYVKPPNVQSVMNAIDTGHFNEKQLTEISSHIIKTLTELATTCAQAGANVALIDENCQTS